MALMDWYTFPRSAPSVSKHPGAVLKEGQTVKVKILSIADGKISLSMKALIQQETEEEEHETFDYKETASATTGLGDLLKGLKL